MIEEKIIETDAEYHARSKSGEFLSYHMLRKYQECPRHYQLIVNGEAPEESDTPAFRLGRAAHCLILEGPEKFHKRYSANAPINEKTGRPYGYDTQKFQNWLAENPGINYIDIDDMAEISKMAGACWQSPTIHKFLQCGEPEKIVRAEYTGVPCQIKIDYLLRENMDAVIVDLKTCQDLTWFEHDAKRFQYVNQFSFYQQVYFCSTGILADVYCVAVEKKFPYRAGIWKISADSLRIAQIENEAVINNFREMRAWRETWPTGYERVRVM